MSAHLGVKCVVMYRDFMCLSALICSCVCAFVTVCSNLCVSVCCIQQGHVKWRGCLCCCPCVDPPPAPRPLCLWALLAQACLSIFVTGLKFDVSYFQLTASEPCMNELVIYTKCLIKSAAAPGINIVERLGIFTARGWGLAHRCICGYHTRLPLRLQCRTVWCWPKSGSACQTKYPFHSAKCICLIFVKKCRL